MSDTSKATVAIQRTSGHWTFLEGELDVGSAAQLPLSDQHTHNPTIWLWTSSTTVVSAESCSRLCRATVASVERDGI